MINYEDKCKYLPLILKGLLFGLINMPGKKSSNVNLVTWLSIRIHKSGNKIVTTYLLCSVELTYSIR